MPGLVAFGRRWAVASDDLVIPALASFTFNSFWVFVLACAFPSISAEQTAQLAGRSANPLDDYYAYQLIGSPPPLRLLRLQLSGLVSVLLVGVIVDGCLGYVSTRGTVVSEGPRMPGTLYLLYARAALLGLKLLLCGLGALWSGLFHGLYPGLLAARLLVAATVAQLASALLIIFCVFCVFDTAGRKWVKARKRTVSGISQLDEEIARSFAAPHRNLRHSRLELSYRASWRRRLRLFLCCLRVPKTHQRDSFSEVARLLSDFFWESDVVASDLVTGLILLRKLQQAEKRKILGDASDTYQFLSGAAITPATDFLDLAKPDVLAELRGYRWYMGFALAAYGWPFYLRYHNDACCRLLSCRRGREPDDAVVVEDNCLGWNAAALRLTLPRPSDIRLIYANFHCEVGETPFFLAVDREAREIVVSIRGTLTLTDIMTDMTANLEEIPLKVRPAVAYLGHAGIVRAANYVMAQLIDNKLIEKAQQELDGTGRLVVVGHSLGAGTATVLGLLMRRRYPDLICYAFSPPGGLLSWEGAEATRDWVRTLIVGKDCVSRLGLAQMDSLRAQLTQLLSHCKETKWKVIGQSLPCCQGSLHDDLALEPLLEALPPPNPLCREQSCQKLYLPGKIVHVVRTWSKETRKSGRPDYAGLRTDGYSFDNILVSPVMIHDHMPDGIIEALDKIVERSERLISEAAELGSELEKPTPFPPLETPLSAQPNSQLERLKSNSTPGHVGLDIAMEIPRGQPPPMDDDGGEGSAAVRIDITSPTPQLAPKGIAPTDSRTSDEGQNERKTVSFSVEDDDDVDDEEDEEEDEPKEDRVFSSSEVLSDTPREHADARRTKSTVNFHDRSVAPHPEIKHVKSEAFKLDSGAGAPLHRCEDVDDLRGSTSSAI